MDGGELRGEEIVSLERRLQEGDRWERIRESRYNMVWGGKGGGGSGLLKEGVGEEQMEKGS